MTDTSIKRFAVFSGREYYASGGWHDYRGSFETVDGAIQAGQNRLTMTPDDDDDDLRGADKWWHVVDLETGLIIKGSKRQAHSAEWLEGDAAL